MPEPTDAYPGTAAKIEVLRRRAAARLELFHPRDKKLDAADRRQEAVVLLELAALRAA